MRGAGSVRRNSRILDSAAGLMVRRFTHELSKVLLVMNTGTLDGIII